MIRFTVPGEPIPKGRARIGKMRTATGKTIAMAYTPKKTRDFEQLVGWHARVAMGAKPPLAGPVALTITAYLPVPPSWSKKKQAAALAGQVRPTARPDADNVAKAALDSINKVVFADDSQVVTLTVHKHFSGEPRLEVEILPLDLPIL